MEQDVLKSRYQFLQVGAHRQAQQRVLVHVHAAVACMHWLLLLGWGPECGNTPASTARVGG